ncbi:MAG TPA: M56 family metallopeptidase [Candidatus Sulfotelmatobacter sp.]
MTAAFDLNPIAQTSAVQIVNCLVEGTLIAIFAGLMLSVTRRRNAVTRFAVWFCALMAIAILPFFANSLGTHVVSNRLALAERPAITLPGTWALYLLGAWAAIAAWHLIGVGRGLWHLHTLRKSCAAIDPATLDPLLQNTLVRNQSPRRIVLCTSDLAQVPTALGLVKPAIVMPAWVLRELSAEELNQILLHEIAHLRRWDDWTNLAQKLVKALFFFHPAVWWIEMRVSLEREMACDDAVLAETASPRAYAECLAHLAEKTLIQRSLAFAQAALGKIHQTSLRVAQILDANRPTGKGRSWKPAVSFVAVFAMASGLGIARAPRLIAFSDRGTSPVSASATIDSSVDQVASRRMLASMPIVPVSVKIAPQPRTRLANTKPATPATRRKAEAPEDTVANQLAAADQPAATMVGLTRANGAAFAVTETLFVVVEGNEHGPANRPVFQIQMWRVMVLHPVVDPNSNRIPAKQT